MGILYRLYRIRHTRTRKIIRMIVYKLEKGHFYSRTLRRIFKDYHGVEIGMYSHGECFTPFSIDPHTTIGRYCSIARDVRVLNHNHPLEFKSTHAFFFNNRLGFTKEWLVEFTPLEIGHDVWFGNGAIVMPGVTSIGTGSVIGAGAVVNKNIPPYAVVLGNPGRVVKYRFTPEKIQELIDSKWWEKDIDELDISEFTHSLESQADKAGS